MPSSDLPLNQKTIVLTRALEQQGEAHSLFKLKGAKVLDLPALVIGPPKKWDDLDKALNALETFDWIVFSSSNGVKAVEERLQTMSLSLVNNSNRLKIAAVGRKTAISLKKMGVIPDFVPPKFVADSLIEHFPFIGEELKMLIPRVQSGGRTILAESFGEAGMKVVEVAAYESSCPKQIPERTVKALLNREVDAIIFTSGKTVVHTAQLLFQRFGNDWQKNLDEINLISIGPQTSLSCKKYFSRVDQEAEPHDLEGLVNACILSFNQKENVD